MAPALIPTITSNRFEIIMSPSLECGVDANCHANGHRAKPPSLHTLSLTEYSANPSFPPNERTQEPPKFENLPADFLLPNGYPDYLRLILTSKVYDVIDISPMTYAANLSSKLDCRVMLKREDLLPVFSFKLRGAYNKMAHLDPLQTYKGVVACSAGNHAQGVAFSARELKIPATIVMPKGTPSIKHKNVARMGGNVKLHGLDFDEAKEECRRLEVEHSLINISPFDDPYVIAGQGTIGMEILQQCQGDLRKVKAIFVCIGGGGLIAGIGYYIKRLAPHIRIIGVETHDANAMVQSIRAGKRILLPKVGLFADGTAVKLVGEETFRVAREVIDEIVEVTTDEICAAIKDVFEDTRSILEPSGALSLAGLKKWVGENPTEDVDRQVIAIASGANMDFDRLRFVAERASLGEGREVLLSVTIPEKPGSFLTLVEAVMPHMISEFSYRYAGEESANVLLGITLEAPAHQRATELDALLERMRADDMAPTDLSDDELAKSHIRYIIGGRSNVPDERLYMFSFPERGGALEKFLGTLKDHYNISLFQYRNAGSDIGKVLTGIRCPEAQKQELEVFLNDIGYPWEDCTNSKVFETFLRA